jgi:hypothetical protein
LASDFQPVAAFWRCRHRLRFSVVQINYFYPVKKQAPVLAGACCEIIHLQT